MPESTPPRRRARSSPLPVALIGAAAIAVIVAVGLARPRDPWERSGPPLTVTSWAPYWQPDTALASFTANSDMFADVSVVAYSARGVDSIVTYEQLPATTLDSYRAATAPTGVPLIATIFDDSPAGTMAAILADPAQRAVHVDTIVALVTAGGFAGVDLDYEKFAFADGRDTWATTRPNWIAFLTELGARLDRLGAQLIVSVPPVYDGGQTGDSGYWVYDYAAMGEVVDRIRIMTYDWSVAGGDPGPIAPIDWVADVVEATSELVDPAKLDLGIPVYGYDWVVAVTGACPADQQPETRAISTVRAARLTAERGIVPTWDETTAERRFDYVDTLSGLDAAGAPTTCTVERTVRYLDATAVHRRAWLAHRGDFHGVALWALGNDDDETWQALRAARLGEQTWEGSVPTATTAPVTVQTTTPATG